MRRTPLFLIGAGALVLAACGGSSTPAATAAASSPSGPARTCSAKLRQSGTHLIVTVTTDGESVIYAQDSRANPSTVSYTLTHAPWVATLTLNDPTVSPVKVHVFGDRQETSCSPKST
ncbi:MAG: hypothetical protein ACYCZV_12475 [Acidimicrobiales bacterium]